LVESRESTPIPTNGFPPLTHRYAIQELDSDGSYTSQKPAAIELIPLDAMNSLSEHSLSMHLYQAYQHVLASREAMWEELRDRLRNKNETLKPFGWEDDEELELHNSRQKFDLLIERYTR